MRHDLPSRTLVAVCLIALALAAMTALVLHGVSADGDLAVLHGIARLDVRAPVHLVARVFVIAGQFWLVGGVVAAAAAVTSLQQRAWSALLIVLAALTVLTVALAATKAVLGRSSPGSGADMLFTGGQSYPSGHAATSVLLVPLLAALLRLIAGTPPTPHRLGARAGADVSSLLSSLSVLSAVVAVGVGVSTVVLGYHWPTDVAAGWLLGLLVLLPTLAVLRRLPHTLRMPGGRAVPGSSRRIRL